MDRRNPANVVLPDTATNEASRLIFNLSHNHTPVSQAAHALTPHHHTLVSQALTTAAHALTPHHHTPVSQALTTVAHAHTPNHHTPVWRVQ